jgi:hypothetical protein
MTRRLRLLVRASSGRVEEVGSLSDERFDALAKAAALTTSRRQALKLIGGSLGALFAGGWLAGRGGAAGKNCLEPGFQCRVNGDCCHTPLGNSCCCHGTKLSSAGICADRDVCVRLGGTCRERAAGTECLPLGSVCKTNGDCCNTSLGPSCCCRGSKKAPNAAICVDRTVCIALGGACH